MLIHCFQWERFDIKMHSEVEEIVPHTIIPPQPEKLTQGKLSPWIRAVDPKFWPDHLYLTGEIQQSLSGREHFFSIFTCLVLINLWAL